jgi:hypothetical protein
MRSILKLGKSALTFGVGATLLFSSVPVSFAGVMPTNVPGSLVVTPDQASATQAAILALVNSEKAKQYPNLQTADDAMASALSNLFLSTEVRYGANTSGGLTSVFIATLLPSVSESVIGTALANASIASGTSGAAVALDVANEGTSGIVQAFVATSKSRGAYTLASIASGDPDAVAAILQNVLPLSAAPPNPAVPPCPNPSCS